VESILLRWKNSGLCDPSDVLILHAQSDIAKSPIGDRRVLVGRNLRECTEQEDTPGTIRHTSVHKAKGLDSKAVILIGMPPHKDLATDYDHYTWFMAASRARQLLAVVEN
jgi:superfamily I DNA/RNA helicase